MKTIGILKSGKQLRGIYHTDLEGTGELADPLHAVVGAPSKLITGETAAQLGFGNPWAHPNSSEEMRHAQWLHQRHPGHQQELAHEPSRGIHI